MYAPDMTRILEMLPDDRIVTFEEKVQAGVRYVEVGVYEPWLRTEVVVRGDAGKLAGRPRQFFETTLNLKGYPKVIDTILARIGPAEAS